MTTSSCPAYREARSEWLEVIPDHWGEGKLRWLSKRYAGGTPDKAREDYWTDGTIPWLNSGSVNQGLIREPSAFITEDAFANSSARWVPAGALVMALAGQGKTKGMVAQLDLTSACNQSMAAIVPNAELQARFLYWWLDSNYQNLRNMAGGDNRDGLNLELLGNVGCPVPPAAEQIAIAAFLDRETGKIDALVEAQRVLIELLKEKRQAVISHAVTEGLDPSVPTKESGIEWLGKVPAHWDVVPIKSQARLAGRIGYRGYTTQDIVEDGAGALAISPGNLRDGEIDTGRGTYLSWPKFHESPEIVVEPSDVILVKTGSTYGKVARFKREKLPPATINPQMLLLKGALCGQEYLYMSLASSSAQAAIQASNTGGTIPTITQEFVGNLKIAVPPLGEVVEIVTKAGSELDRLAELIEEAHVGIELLRERRAALISAAVTGKIEVRGLAPSQAEAA